jgi:predicted PurR-regulated permease PerM
MRQIKVQPKQPPYSLVNTFEHEDIPMTRLAGILFSIISTTLMGVAIIVALVSGNDTLTPIVIAAVIGFVLAIPVTWIVTKKIVEVL